MTASIEREGVSPRNADSDGVNKIETRPQPTFVLPETSKYGKMVLQTTYRRRLSMETVTVSPKYQVVIPNRIRGTLGVKPGQKVKVFLYDNRIEMVPVKPIKQSRGFLRGINTLVEREPDRV
jgi:AbrB family looped-hinge helix DNA binding protein